MKNLHYIEQINAPLVAVQERNQKEEYSVKQRLLKEEKKTETELKKNKDLEKRMLRVY